MKQLQPVSFLRTSSRRVISYSILALSIRDGIIIGTKNLKETDISADIDLISTKNSPFIEWKSDGRRIALMNSFGFGGAFVSLCLAEFRK